MIYGLKDAERDLGEKDCDNRILKLLDKNE